MNNATVLAKEFPILVMEEISRNSMETYLIALGVALGGCCFVLLLRGVISRWLHSRLEKISIHGRIDPVLVLLAIKDGIRLLSLWPIYAGYALLHFSKHLSHTIDTLFLLLFTYYSIRFFSDFFVFIADTMLRGQSKLKDGRHQGAKAIVPIVRSVVWALGLTFLLDNLGFQISSIIAGLGIVGVAVGLAGQTILADFFGYLVILLDHPFTIGDIITTNGVSGRVERIGIKTTHIRSEAGVLIVVPNSELTKTSLNNYDPAKRLTRTITFLLSYDTPLEKLKAVPDMMREEAAAIQGVTVSFVHFSRFGEYGLVFDVGISIEGHDLDLLLQVQDAMNYAILERFHKEGVEMTYAGKFGA